MEFKIKFASGKEISLTLDEIRELFGVQPQPVVSIPFIQTWPQYPPPVWYETTTSGTT